MYDDEHLLPLSALQHFVFCARRAALVHLEGMWEDNVATIEGQIVHVQSHGGLAESRGDTRIVRGLLLRSLSLGVSGKGDVVEFHRVHRDEPNGIEIDGVEGRWRPYPVEYKRGRRRDELSYRVQVCAQALCLEEMLGVTVPEGSLFYAKTARRQPVVFDEALRKATAAAAEQLHELFEQGKTPVAVYVKNKCSECSLLDVCLPRQAASCRCVGDYLARMASNDAPSLDLGEVEER